MEELKVVLIPVMLIGFAVAFFLQFRLHKYVSKQKIIETDDVTKLWKNSIPPKEILNEEGLKLYKYFKTGIFTFMGGIIILIFGDLLSWFFSLFF